MYTHYFNHRFIFCNFCFLILRILKGIKLILNMIRNLSSVSPSTIQRACFILPTSFIWRNRRLLQWFHINITRPTTILPTMNVFFVNRSTFRFVWFIINWLFHQLWNFSYLTNLFWTHISLFFIIKYFWWISQSRPHEQTLFILSLIKII